MSRIAITGASGFVGINLHSYLQSRGVEVLPLSRTNGLSYNQVDESFLNERSVKAIVHLAGKAHDLRKTKDPDAYYQVNTNLTRYLFDAFVRSDAEVFIYLSSVKAVADTVKTELTEEDKAEPATDYGRSKLMAEQYLEDACKTLSPSRRVYILRPCMIHGPGNKGNLNLLYQVVKNGIPYPLAAFHNQRSLLSVENLCFVIAELLKRKDIPSGIYHVADKNPLSTMQIIEIIAESLRRKKRSLAVPPAVVNAIARVGDFLPLPLNTERLRKLTENYIVANRKLITALGKELPVDAETGLRRTIESFEYVD